MVDLFGEIDLSDTNSIKSTKNSEYPMKSILLLSIIDCDSEFRISYSGLFVESQMLV